MATVTFNIPNNQLQRLSNKLHTVGYVFDPALGTTDTQQKRNFFLKRTVKLWESELFNAERQEAIDSEPNDTAAAQAVRFVGLDDVTGTIS